MDVSDNVIKSDNAIVALLGPTNTGKTHLALEEMLSFDTGCIGFPLRLLARECYDKLVQKAGVNNVALITGEEKILPPHARYFACTTESMPMDRDFEYIGVDEIQLCADQERGHIYTDRLLRCRGTVMTMFMGADTIAPILKKLIPHIKIDTKTRLSQLSYAGYKKMSRLPRRTAVVSFSMDDVYALAELMKRQRGGAAVVLGALSPRARNKQVELFQSGDVDYMIATDAIGMGLNMDLNHVALAATRKYDGKSMRSLTHAEMAQIAGRAGRYKRNGSFGVTGNVNSLSAEAISAIEHHRFEPLKKLVWRNTYLDFTSLSALLRTLDAKPRTDLFVKSRPADDYLALSQLAKRLETSKRASSPMAIKLLWETCQIPDFRNNLSEKHHDFIADIYADIIDHGRIKENKIRERLKRLHNVTGNIDTLMNRIAYTRTWTYITHKSAWLDNAHHWAGEARRTEDLLSDALHNALTKKFVDKRTSVLLKAQKQDGALLGGVRSTGEVIIEGQTIGQLDGFQFISEDASSGLERKTLMNTARKILKPEIKNRVIQMLKAEHSQFELTDTGQILYQAQLNNPLPGVAVAALQKGSAQLKPEIKLVKADLLDGQDEAAVKEKLENWLKTEIETVLENLIPLEEGKELEGAAKGIAFQVYEALGIIRRKDVEELIGNLTEDDRRALRQHHIRLGPVLAFIPALNKPAAVKLRAILWSLWNSKELPAPTPNAGATSVTVTSIDNLDPQFFQSVGYPVYGPRAIRVDMLDRLISAIFDGAEHGEFKAKHEMAEWLGCSIPDLYQVLEAMGHKKIHDPEENKTEGEDTADTSEKEAPADKPAEDTTAETASEETENTTEAKTEEKPEEDTAEKKGAKDTQAVRPELATFRLYRSGKRSQNKFKGKKDNGEQNKKGKPHNKKRKGGPKDKRNNTPRVISAAPKSDNAASPFAVLESMKENIGKK